MADVTSTKGYQSVFNGVDTYNHNGSVVSSCVSFGLYNAKTKTKNYFKGLCAQGLQAQAGQQPQLIYELGSNNYYEIASKPSGSGTLQNVFGPTKEVLSGLKDLANLCYETKLQVKVLDCAGKCKSGTISPSTAAKQQSFVFAGGFLTSVSLSANSQSFLLNGSWTFTFQDLQENSK